MRALLYTRIVSECSLRSVSILLLFCIVNMESWNIINQGIQNLYYKLHHQQIKQKINNMATHEKLRIRVHTNKSLNFIIAIQHNQTINELAARALKCFFELTDGHSQIKAIDNRKLLTVSSIKFQGYFISKNEIASSILRDNDEIECCLTRAKTKFKSRLREEKILCDSIKQTTGKEKEEKNQVDHKWNEGLRQDKKKSKKERKKEKLQRKKHQKKANQQTSKNTNPEKGGMAQFESRSPSFSIGLRKHENNEEVPEKGGMHQEVEELKNQRKCSKDKQYKWKEEKSDSINSILMVLSRSVEPKKSKQKKEQEHDRGKLGVKQEILINKEEDKIVSPKVTFHNSPALSFTHDSQKKTHTHNSQVLEKFDLEEPQAQTPQIDQKNKNKRDKLKKQEVGNQPKLTSVIVEEQSELESLLNGDLSEETKPKGRDRKLAELDAKLSKYKIQLMDQSNDEQN